MLEVNDLAVGGGRNSPWQSRGFCRSLYCMMESGLGSSHFWQTPPLLSVRYGLIGVLDSDATTTINNWRDHATLPFEVAEYCYLALAA